VTAKMVRPSSTPSKSKGKQLAVNSEESDADRTPGLKDILVKSEGVYRHTQTCTGTISPVDYTLLAKGIKVNDEHSAIIESQSSNYSSKTTTFAYMAGTPEEVAKRFEEQALVQKEQFDMIRTQEESIDALKQMLPQLLKDKKNQRLIQEVQRQMKGGGAHLLHIPRMTSILTLSHPNLHLKRWIT